MIWCPVGLDLMFGCCPGFIAGMNATADCTFYTSGLSVSKSNTSSPLPLRECTYATLVLSFSCNSDIVF